MQTELILLANEKKIKMLGIVLPYIRSNITECDKIYVISKGSCKNDVMQYSEVIFVDEDDVLSGLSYESVKRTMRARNDDGLRAGWYLQQFIKMAWALKTISDAYIVWDIDTLPLHEIQFMKDGKFLFTIKIEHHQPYFDTLEKLTGIKEYYDGSFVAEHMIIVSEYMRSLLRAIMENPNLCGSLFFERIIGCIDLDELGACGFSEFETYGNYVMKYYPETYVARKLRTCRQGSLFLCSNPSKEILDWASEDFDIVSLEGNNRRFEFMVMFSKYKIIRKLIPMRIMVEFRKKLRNIYGAIVGKEYIDFE